MSFNDRAFVIPNAKREESTLMEKVSLIASVLTALILGFILSLSISYLTAAIDKNENGVVSMTEREITHG